MFTVLETAKQYFKVGVPQLITSESLKAEPSLNDRYHSESCMVVLMPSENEDFHSPALMPRHVFL